MRRVIQKLESIPLPRQRPGITITPSTAPPFEVDWKEFGWWFAIPEIGDRKVWGMYYPPLWKLDYYYDMQALRPAVVHGIDGVEIACLEYEVGEQKRIHPWTFFARQTESRVQCLANICLQGGTRRLYTLLDEGFDVDWGENQRLVRPTGRFELQADGSHRQCVEGRAPGETAEAMETCQVAIGEHSFSCLRVVDVDPVFDDNSVLIEAYLTREGRTILCRRYNGRQWSRGAGSAHADRPPWDERFPGHNRIVIDGVTFVHWYDCLTDLACGLDAGALESPHSAW